MGMFGCILIQIQYSPIEILLNNTWKNTLNVWTNIAFQWWPYQNYNLPKEIKETKEIKIFIILPLHVKVYYHLFPPLNIIFGYHTNISMARNKWIGNGV